MPSTATSTVARAGGAGNTFSASPWAADGKVYLLSEDGHTFVIEALDVKEELSPNVGARVEFSAEPGEYEFNCDVPGHDDMKGTLTVE